MSVGQSVSERRAVASSGAISGGKPAAGPRSKSDIRWALKQQARAIGRRELDAAISLVMSRMAHSPAAQGGRGVSRLVLSAVLRSMSDYVDERGGCFVGAHRIADDAGCGLATAQRALAVLGGPGDGTPGLVFTRRHLDRGERYANDTAVFRGRRGYVYAVNPSVLSRMTLAASNPNAQRDLMREPLRAVKGNGCTCGAQARGMLGKCVVCTRRKLAAPDVVVAYAAGGVA